jgi:ABC-type branched-subunit amino acid transport system ATPase component
MPTLEREAPRNLSPDAVRPDEGQAPMLRLEGVTAGYGGFDILHGVSLEVRRSEIVSVLGPNGSGKSTVFKAVYGLIPVRSGEVHLGETDIAKSGPQELLRGGVAMVPQLSTVFPEMSVRDNLELGMYLVRDRKLVKQRVDDVFDLFPRLAERRNQHAGLLSGGERRALEIGRSLMLDPKLVLMDEPSVGLSPILVQEVFDQLVELRDTAGITFLIIEQNARSALAMSDWGYVIERGRVTFSGTGQDLLDDGEVRRAFLGG